MANSKNSKNNVLKYLVILLFLACIGIFFYQSKQHKTNNHTDKTPCLIIAITAAPKSIPKERFNPQQPPEGQQFYIEPTNAKPWTETSFDVEGNGDKERILYASIAMNHTPHLLQIVKNNFIIFKAEGANIKAQEVPDHNGFLLHETIDWNTNSYKIIRYTYNKGKFIPI